MDCRFFITSVIRDPYSVTWSVKYLLAFGKLFLILYRQLFNLKTCYLVCPCSYREKNGKSIKKLCKFLRHVDLSIFHTNDKFFWRLIYHEL